MATNEESRHHLDRKLEDPLGPSEPNVRFDRTADRFVYIDGRFEEMGRRFDRIERRLEDLPRKFPSLLSSMMTCMAVVFAAMAGAIVAAIRI